MQKRAVHSYRLLPVLLGGVLMCSFTGLNDYRDKAFPYKNAGLTERQAAAHLLGRFTFGARPGEVDQVVKTGLEQWFETQLAAGLQDADLNERLAGYSSLRMSNAEIVATFPKKAQILRMAIRDGVVEKENIRKEDQETYRGALAAYMKKHGYKPQRRLHEELISQKILRATYSHNQLQEVLTSFWFNHFNVSVTDNDCARFITTYERDAIRANALGNFETMLLATAKSPAMLTYLDNFKSTAPANAETDRRKQLARKTLRKAKTAEDSVRRLQIAEKLIKGKKEQGLNENYAREIMELHTLGVDAGYTQRDVTEAARILTGWTVYPGLSSGSQKQGKNERPEKFSENGFVREGDFLFAKNRHDQEAKVVMGREFPPRGGYEEGVALIRMLARHEATAHFVAHKIAVRFVNDNPPDALVKKLAATFKKSDGDIKKVLTTLVFAPEFWSNESVREKTKSPFELVISAVRGLDAEVTNPLSLYSWITKMGEKIYAYQAPTGFPDTGQYWINTGSLLTRMNFGLALASGRIDGITIDLSALHHNREPESAGDALMVYSQYLLPGRDLEETINRLVLSVNDPEFGRKVNEADKAPIQHRVASDNLLNTDSLENESLRNELDGRRNKKRKNKFGQDMGVEPANADNQVLAQVVGIIIGSPEFQRR